MDTAMSQPSGMMSQWNQTGKKCPACGLTKPAGDFNWRNAARTRLQSYCRSCSNGVWRAWYEEPENKKRHLAGLMRRRLRRTERNLKLVTDLKSNPCADCGKVFPTYVMDFDHVGIKTSEVSALVRSHSTERLLAEIQQCEVVCANCHRERTHRRAIDQSQPRRVRGTTEGESLYRG